MNRFKAANEIWNVGASNPRGVANALLDAMREDGCDPANDAAVKMILDHLCFLCGLPQPSLSMSDSEWLALWREVSSREEAAQSV